MINNNVQINLMSIRKKMRKCGDNLCVSVEDKDGPGNKKFDTADKFCPYSRMVIKKDDTAAGDKRYKAASFPGGNDDIDK